MEPKLKIKCVVLRSRTEGYFSPMYVRFMIHSFCGLSSARNPVHRTSDMISFSSVLFFGRLPLKIGQCPGRLNPKKTGLFWRLERLPPPPPLEISAVDRAIAATICTMVVCDVIYKIVYLDFQNIVIFYINKLC